MFGGEHAASVLRSLERGGFTGEVWPVNPRRTSIEGRRCIARLEALPRVPDAAYLAVNREQTVELVGALADLGCGGVIAYAAGFAEAGAHGAVLQERLVAAAGAMPVIGPNCYGFLNYVDGAALWLDHHGGRRCSRGVAILAQSSNIAINLTMQRRGLPIAYVVALGNQAIVDCADLIEALAARPEVTALGLHLEGFNDVEHFAAAASTCSKPIVILKTGRSPGGAAQARTHTAALSGGDAVMTSFLQRLGVAQAPSLTVFLEALKILHTRGPLADTRLVSLSCSGGEAALIADAARNRAVRFLPFTADEQASIAATTHSLVPINNPFDFHTFDWLHPERLSATFETVMRVDADLILLLLDMPRNDRLDDTEWMAVLAAWRRAARACRRPTALVATLPECMPEHVASGLVEDGIVPLFGIEDALDAISAANAPVPGPPPRLAIAAPDPSDLILLDEPSAKEVLAGSGVPVPEGVVVGSSAQAVAAAQRLGRPVVLKAVGIAHKSDRQALRLGLETTEDVERAAEELLPLTGRLLVERMMGGTVVELIVGAARDPVVGLHLVLGAGGILVELLDDTVVLLMPNDRETIRKALLSLRMAALFEGCRGRPPAALEPAIDAIMAIERFVLAHADRLVELDVNPLMVSSDVAVAVDALIRLSGES